MSTVISLLFVALTLTLPYHDAAAASTLDAHPSRAEVVAALHNLPREGAYQLLWKNPDAAIETLQFSPITLY
jgi:hypothetical protein